ncbi:interferon-induced protein with tetratricopeptide repeats 1-like [Lepisosteus oculatus]|uniref:interferon-induced protein with tetratricopeptide repeats 1-like n=1 Tax=Lepisosteus oculatus TaxID=7918 RepID=UPI00371D45EF
MALNQSGLKAKLEKLECHFTWDLKKDLLDLKDLEDRLEEDIQFCSGKDKWISRVYSLLAYVKYLLAQHDEALRCLEKAEHFTRKNQENAYEKKLIVTYGDFAWLHYELGEYSTAQGYLEKLQEMENKVSTSTTLVLHPEVFGEKGWSLLKFSREHYETAKECFEIALKEEPLENEWHAGYAIALTRMEGLGRRERREEDSRALVQLRHARQLDQQNAFVAILLALKLADYGHVDEAKKLTEQTALTSQEDPQVIRYVVKFFREHGELDRAFEILEKALKLSPNSCFLKQQLALCCKWKVHLFVADKKHNKEEKNKFARWAIELYEEIMMLQSKYLHLHTDLAQMYAELGNIEKAEEIFQTAFRRIHQMNPVEKQALYLCYGNFQVYYRQSALDAIPWYKEAVKLPCTSREREKCIKKLKQIRYKLMKTNVEEAQDILNFIDQFEGKDLGHKEM